MPPPSISPFWLGLGGIRPPQGYLYTTHSRVPPYQLQWRNPERVRGLVRASRYVRAELKETLRDRSGVDSEPPLWGALLHSPHHPASVAVPLSPLAGADSCSLEDTVRSTLHLNRRGQVWSLMEQAPFAFCVPVHNHETERYCDTELMTTYIGSDTVKRTRFQSWLHLKEPAFPVRYGTAQYIIPWSLGTRSCLLRHD